LQVHYPGIGVPPFPFGKSLLAGEVHPAGIVAVQAWTWLVIQIMLNRRGIGFQVSARAIVNSRHTNLCPVRTYTG
jgi:hypothetical protein